MNEITLTQLTRQHLASWQTIDAVDDSGLCQRVWDSLRMVATTSPLVAGKVMRCGVIRVASLENDLESVYAKLASTDPFESKRLVR
jgi:hypothetical protein